MNNVHKYQMDGAFAISQERRHQFDLGRTVENDVKHNDFGQLRQAAIRLVITEKMLSEDQIFLFCPIVWDLKYWSKMCNKPYKKRLIIAGALIAAEIDRISQ